MISFTNIVEEFTGNGFTQPEALDIAVEIALLSDPNKRWSAGVAACLIKDAEFNSFNASNEWQREVVAPLAKLKGRERQCYFLHKIERISTLKIAAELGISRSTVKKNFVLAERRLLAPAGIKHTKEAISRLTGRQRECYELYMDSWSQRDIATKMGLSRSTVDHYLLMADRKLRLSEV